MNNSTDSLMEIIAECHDQIKHILDKEITDEMAIPAYTQGRWYSRIVFWGKLNKIIRLLDLQPNLTIFDFGTGTGILLPRLVGNGRKVLATDIHLQPSKCLVKKLELENIEIMDSKIWNERIIDNSLDRIIAANVLEHVYNRPELLKIFKKKLKRGGKLIISGPTENSLYRLGRRIIGFSGEYHVTNITHNIDECKEAGFELSELIKYPLPSFMCLYQIASFKKENLLKCIICETVSSKCNDEEVFYCKPCNHYTYYPSEHHTKNLDHPLLSESLTKLRKKHSRKIISEVAKYLDLEDKIIEIGAGKGYLIREFSKSFSNTTALDIDTTFRNDFLNDNLSFIEKDIEELTSLRGYQVVIGSHVIEHLKSPGKFIKICDKSNVRYIMFELPTNGGFSFHASIILRKIGFFKAWNRFFQKMSNSPHYQYFSDSSITKLFEKHNYKVVKKIKLNMVDYIPNFKRINATEGLIFSILSSLFLSFLECLNFFFGKSDTTFYLCENISLK